MTFSKIRFHPLDPRPEEVSLMDIAFSLSHQCRFYGHLPVHYSVAQHSAIVCDLLGQQGASREVSLWGLLHDASEAYLGDMVAPLKRAPEMVEYRMAERRVMAAICMKFGLPLEEPALVKVADQIVLATEFRDLRGGPPAMRPGKELPPPMAGHITPMGAREARGGFLTLAASFGLQVEALP